MQTKSLEAEARANSDKYEWVVAADLYDQIARQYAIHGNTLEQSRNFSLAGECVFKAAFQAPDPAEFQRRMLKSKEIFDYASRQFDNAGTNGYSKLIRSRSLFVDFFMTGETSEQRKTVGASISMVEEAIKILENSKDRGGVAKARSILLAYLSESVPLTQRYSDFRQQLELVLTLGEAAANDEDWAQHSEVMLESLWRAVVCSAMYFDYAFSVSEIEPIATRIRLLGKRLAEISNVMQTEYSRAIKADAAAFLAFNFEGDPSKASAIFSEGLTHAKLTKDSLLIAWFALQSASTGTSSFLHVDDAEKRREILERSRTLCEEAIRSLDISKSPRLLQNVYGCYAEYYGYLARFVETDTLAKTRALNEAVELVKVSRSLGDFVHTWSLSYYIYFLCLLMENREEKSHHLEEALALAEVDAKKLDLHENPDSTSRATV